MVYLNYLHDEMHLIFHLKAYKDRSVLLRQHGLAPDTLIAKLQQQLSYFLKGILQDIARQKMVDVLIGTLHRLCDTSGAGGGFGGVGPGGQPLRITDNTAIPMSAALHNVFLPSSSSSPAPGGGGPGGGGGGGATPAGASPFPAMPGMRPNAAAAGATVASSHHQQRERPIFQLLEMLLHRDLKQLDFSANKEWPESDGMTDVARTLWQIVAEKCRALEKFVVPKELSYSSTMNGVIRGAAAHLTHLTLKRNIPNNVFLHQIGTNCPNLAELDIAGADVVTDFGVVCLLFQDPEQIFVECWNREKTVGSVRKSLRAFPHPHFDKPIPDPTEAPPANARAATQFLHLKKSFHDAVRDSAYEWDRLPVAKSLQKLRLENTKVKGDGASVVLECCPKIYSLGYLVFAAAGLKQVYGYEDIHETKFTEIFYRGPSDQKLLTIANCCPKLTTMFLGSNSVRSLTAGVFQSWTDLQYLTLENIVVEDVSLCLEIAGRKLKGLKIQCSGFDLVDIAIHCPELESLVIQKEVPLSSLSLSKLNQRGSNWRLFGSLAHLEVTCASLPKTCLNFVLKYAIFLRNIKVFHVPGLKKADFEGWSASLQYLETLILYRAPELNRETVEFVLESLPSLQRFGDLHSFDLKRPYDIKRLATRVKDERWDLELIDSPTYNISDEKEFSKLLSLHWFYLTESPGPGHGLGGKRKTGGGGGGAQNAGPS